MSLERTNLKTTLSQEMDAINKSFNNELSIYGQAHLNRNDSLRKAIAIDKSFDEIGVIFKLDGELQGSIICTLNLKEHELDNDKTIFFQSLFMESMNILLGSFLTNLEEESGVMSIISNPRFMSKNDVIPHDLLNNYTNVNIWNLGYLFQTTMGKYDCKVQMIAKKNRTIEV